VDPNALGVVLAMLVDRNGKPVPGGSARGQLYASGEGLVVLRPTAREELLHRAGTVLLAGSVVAVVANVFTLKSMAVIWAAAAAQAIYWFALPARRRALEPVPLGAEALEAARHAGRAALAVPAGAVLRAIPPEPPKQGFRKPARFELADGALDIYLSQEQFDAARAALGR